jgi:hypothetical protein
MTDTKRIFERLSLRSEFQSLFWNVLLMRKQQEKFTFKALADALGNNKSYVSRSFSRPPNWQIDKISDMSDALGVDLIVEARDRKTGVIYSANGTIRESSPVVAETEARIPTGGERKEEETTAAPDRKLKVVASV